MKRVIIILILVAGAFSLACINPEYLVRLDRRILAETQGVKPPELLQHLAGQIKIYHTTENYILASAASDKLKNFPKTAYRILDTFPPKGYWYLASILPEPEVRIPSSLATEIIRMDQTLILQSDLTEFELIPRIKLHLTRLEFIPLPVERFQNLQASTLVPRDVNSLIAQVNADSIVWFIQQLQNFGTRFAGATNRLQVATWIRSQFLRFGYTDAQLSQFIIQTYDQYNVVATLPGTLCPNKVIVIGGHHDSILFDGNDPYIVAPGADDNASGTAAVLEMARVMKLTNYQPECTIRFITFAAEEVGLWGSRWDVILAEQQQMDIKLMINHDMIANSTQSPTNWQIRLMPYEGFISHTSLAMNIVNTYTTLNPTWGNLNSAGSDSHSYWTHGYPSIYFFEQEFSPYYHSINDVVANINPMYCREAIKASVAVAATFDRMPSPVTNLSVTDTGIGTSLIVSWTAPGEPDVTGYKLTWSTSPEGTPNEITVTGTIHILQNLLPETMYYITLRAVDADLNESMTAYATGIPLINPQTPLGFIDAPQMHSVAFSWQPNQEMDLAGYKICRSENNVFYTLLANLTADETSYTDTNIDDYRYYYYILFAVDNDGNDSNPTEPIRTRGLTLDFGVLIIDETRNSAVNGVFSPTDAVSDAFFESVMHTCQHQQFDIEDNEPIRLADMGIYSSILWHGNDASEMTYPFQNREELRRYIQAGGKVLITSYLPSQAFDMNTGYPYDYQSGSFMYDVLGVETVIYHNSARFRSAVPAVTGYPLLQVDSLKTIPSLNGHIFNVEAIYPAPSAQALYLYGSDYNSSTNQGIMNSMPVGVYSEYGLGKTVLLSYPLYNMKQNQVVQLTNHVFHEIFGETVGIEEENFTPVAELAITKIYPNPFNHMVSIAAGIKSVSRPLEAAVYNIRGQKVKTLFKGIPAKANPSFVWDGTDRRNSAVGNGIYFVSLKQDGKTVSKKLILLR